MQMARQKRASGHTKQAFQREKSDFHPKPQPAHIRHASRFFPDEKFTSGVSRA